MGGECEHGRQGNLASTMGGQDRKEGRKGRRHGFRMQREREKIKKKSKGRGAKRECELSGLK